MSSVDDFLRDAAAFAGVDATDVLARVLHVNDGTLIEFVSTMDDATRALTTRLDHELRIRNPGLHYVIRKMFLGYRREGVTSSPKGERSQIFASIVRRNSRLEVVLPVDADTIGFIRNARDIRGTGHHGVGDVRVSLSSLADIEQFLKDFDDWLIPRT